MRADDQFHLGVVTADVAGTAARLSALFGYRWGPRIGATLDVALPDGPATVQLRCAYSVTLPRIEVVEAVAGTFWEPASAGIHHVGFWSDDVVADAAELSAHGYRTEATRTLPDGTVHFAFLSRDNAFRIELVNRTAETGLARCWAAPDEEWISA
jgi:hypothetical protein